MTDENKKFTFGKKTILASGVGALVLLTGILSSGILTSQQVTAQMPGNQTSPSPGGGGPGGTQTAQTAGKLKALDVITDVLAAKVKIKIAQALQTATEQLGPDAHIIRAELTTDGDNVVFEVIGLKDGRIYKVTVDPVDGAVLENKNFSLRELHEMAMRGELDLKDAMIMHHFMG